jgi:hypothetical protein
LNHNAGQEILGARQSVEDDLVGKRTSPLGNGASKDAAQPGDDAARWLKTRESILDLSFFLPRGHRMNICSTGYNDPPF